MSGTKTIRICCIRTPSNRNSWAAIANATSRAGLSQRVALRFVDRPERVSDEDEVVALSFSTPELEVVAGLVQQLGRKGRLLVAGGPHPSADPEGVLALGFDSVFCGEGEETWPGFLMELLEEKRPSGTIWRPAGPFDLAQSTHAAPDYGLYPFVEISRGCPHGCAFCQTPLIFGRKHRHRPLERIVEGVATAAAAGFRRFRFLAPDAFAWRMPGLEVVRSTERLLERCKIAGARELYLGVFPSEVRPEHVTADMLELVRTYCRNRTIHIGAQSGCPRVLRSMHRGHNPEKVRQAVELVRRAGLRPLVDLIFGFPGETPDERMASVVFAKSLAADFGARLHLHWYIPLPGTPAWPAPAEPAEAGLLRELERLCAGGQASGDWREQIEQGKKILEWRERGMIRV